MDITKSLPEQYLIYGTMGLGGEWNQESAITDKDIKEATAAIDAALESGIRFFDLADIYRFGKSEEVFGRYLKEHRDLREQMIIQSKVGIMLNGVPAGSCFNFSYDHIIKEVDAILSRLGTEYLDILLLHRPDPLLEREGIKRAMDELFAQGKVRALGVSNMDYHQIQLLENYTGRKIVTNQLELSLSKTDFVSSAIGFNNHHGKNLDFQLGTLEYCMLNNVSLQAWSPLAGGIYSGAPLDENAPESVIKTKEIVERIAKDRNVSLDGVVLAWLLRHPAKINPVIGSTNPQRIKNASDAFKVNMTRYEWYELLDASRGVGSP